MDSDDSDNLYWLLDTEDVNRAAYLVDLTNRDIRFHEDRKLWINATKEDWRFLDDCFLGLVFSYGWLFECPKEVPLSLEMNEVLGKYKAK